MWQPAPLVPRIRPPTRPPAGLLHPLPIPGRPWSHITEDFVTGLLESRGNTVILTVVDHFSKAAHFVALPKFSSAFETAELLTKIVVHLHGIPLDMFLTVAPSLFHKFGEPSARL